MMTVGQKFGPVLDWLLSHVPDFAPPGTPTPGTQR